MKGSHFTRKYSVQFVSPDGRASHPFYFFKHLKHEAANTWQVLRSEFDQMLMDNAREKGAEVIEEVTVRETIEENGYVTGVRAVNKAGEPLEFHAPITLDATGRDAFSVTPQRVESARPLPQQDCDLDLLQGRHARSRRR